MRRQELYFQRLGSELWEMTKIYCILKIRANLRSVTIDDRLTDAEETEDGFLTASIMWQRVVCQM